MNNVSLATRTILESYPYLTSEGTILRPFSLSEIEAIGLFRSAKVTAQAAGAASSGSSGSLGLDDLSAPDVSVQLADDVRRMLSHVWKRSDQGFDKLNREIWKNEDFVGCLLRNLCRSLGVLLYLVQKPFVPS